MFQGNEDDNASDSEVVNSAKVMLLDSLKEGIQKYLKKKSNKKNLDSDENKSSDDRAEYEY